MELLSFSTLVYPYPSNPININQTANSLLICHCFLSCLPSLWLYVLSCIVLAELIIYELNIPHIHNQYPPELPSPAPAAFTPLSLHPASKPRIVNTNTACNTHPRGHTSGCEAEEQEYLLWYLLNGNIRIGYTTQLAALQTLCFHGEKLFN